MKYLFEFILNVETVKSVSIILCSKNKITLIKIISNIKYLLMYYIVLGFQVFLVLFYLYLGFDFYKSLNIKNILDLDNVLTAICFTCYGVISIISLIILVKIVKMIVAFKALEFMDYTVIDIGSSRLKSPIALNNILVTLSIISHFILSIVLIVIILMFGPGYGVDFISFRSLFFISVILFPILYLVVLVPFIKSKNSPNNASPSTRR